MDLKKYIPQQGISLYHCDNTDLLATLKDSSVDVILTDPPYLYLKGQKLERPFDEQHFFSECRRVLTKDGFIVLFGRGTSFYRWNTLLNELGFSFKEEVVWNKRRISSPALPLGRLHETISIFTKGKGKINPTTTSYMENKAYDIDRICNDIKRVESSLKNEKTLSHIIAGLKAGEIENIYYTPKHQKHKVSYSGNKKNVDIGIHALKTMVNNISKETSVMSDFGDKYTAIHPTQKPVRLLERLLALVVPKSKAPTDTLVLDPFGGSFSTMVAAYNMGLKGISCEIDEEYFNAGKERIEQIQPKLFRN
jgi:DNA (cytosine-5-)-methyltransferase